MGRQTDGQAHLKTQRRTDKHITIWTNRQDHIWTDTQTNRWTNSQTDGQIDSLAD